jgi:hypothetical protein
MGGFGVVVSFPGCDSLGRTRLMRYRRDHEWSGDGGCVSEI